MITMIENELVENYGYEKDKDGHLYDTVYLDYRDEIEIEKAVKRVYSDYSDINELKFAFIEQLEDNNRDYYEDKLFQDIVEIIEDKNLEIEDIKAYEDIRDTFYVEYYGALDFIEDIEIILSVNFGTKDDVDRETGIQFLRKTLKKIDRELYKEIEQDLIMGHYALSTNLRMSIGEYYRLKNSNKIKIQGSFAISCSLWGALYEDSRVEKALNNITLKTSIENLNTYGYTLDEIVDDETYNSSIVEMI